MRVILVAGNFHPALVEPCLSEAAAQGWKGKGGLMCLESKAIPPATEEADVSEEADEHPRIVVAEFIGESGEFAHVPLFKQLARLLADEPPTLVIDSTTDSARYSDLDRHGHRAADIPAMIAKTLYWMERPPVVLHFHPPTLKPYFVNEWGQVVEYAPVETLHMRGQDIAAIRVHPIWERARLKRMNYKPLRRLKLVLWRLTFGRVVGLASRLVRGRR